MPSNPIHDKLCALCGHKLSLEKFSIDIHGDEGFSFYCKLCEKRLAREQKKIKKKKSR
jgi:hypothetical protein